MPLQRFASMSKRAAFGKSWNASSTLLVFAAAGASLSMIDLSRLRYCWSSAVVSSGALRYFSKRAWNSRLSLMFQEWPFQVRSSLEGLRTGPSNGFDGEFPLFPEPELDEEEDDDAGADGAAGAGA